MLDVLLSRLAEPNIASKHQIIRQYDHEVQAGSVVKPLVGPMQLGPADAAVIRPKPGTRRGVAIGCGLAPHIADPYDMAVAAIDEAIRNVVCVGANLAKTALLDNFCWPGTDDPEAMGTLVRACEACRDLALAYGTPFISGKDSLHNQFTDKATGRVIKIPPTLLISAIGVVDDVQRCCTSDLKRPGEALFLIQPRDAADPAQRLGTHQWVSSMIGQGAVTAAHDVSDGGWLVAAAEMCIGGGLGLQLEGKAPLTPFEEPLGSYLVAGNDAMTVDAEQVRVTRLGTVTAEPVLDLASREQIAVEELTRAWRGEGPKA